MKNVLTVLASAVLSTGLAGGIVVAVACSSSSNGGGGGGSGGYTLTNCPNSPFTGNATCLSCVQSHCATELDTVNTACASFLACACPAGTDASACPAATAADGGTSPCGTALGTVNLSALSDGGFGLTGTGFFGCSISSCETPCLPAADGG